MKTNKQLWNICLKIYQKLFKEAKPSVDFKKLVKEGKTIKANWFMKYYLDQDRQEEILEEFYKKNKLTKRERHKVSKEVHLGSAPNSYKKKEVKDGSKR